MKQLLLIAVAVVVSSALPRRLAMYRVVYEPQAFAVRNFRPIDSDAKTLPSQAAVAHSFPFQHTAGHIFSSHTIANDTPLQNPYSVEPYNYQRQTPSITNIIRDAELDRSEAVVLVGSGLAAILNASLDKTYSSGMQEFSDVTLAMVAAARHILETRVANGKHVSETQFENLQAVEQRLLAVLEIITTIFDGNEGTVYSLPNFFKQFDFDPVERSRFIARILPTISKAVFQVMETSSSENVRDAYNVFLPAVREFLENRVANGKPVYQQQFDYLERAERLMPPLMQAFVTVLHQRLLVDFMERLQLDSVEKIKYIVSSLFASMDIIFKYPNASVTDMMREITLALMSPARQALEDRLAQGKPVTRENFENLERMEQTLPIILDAYMKIMNDFGIP